MNKIYVIFFYFLHLINVQAANTDNLDAQENLSSLEDYETHYKHALRLKDGIEVEKNEAEAIEYLNKAIQAKNDYYQAYETLAEFYEYGSKENIKYLDLASEHGSVIACNKLYNYYFFKYAKNIENEINDPSTILNLLVYIKRGKMLSIDFFLKINFDEFMYLHLMKNRNPLSSFFMASPKYVHLLMNSFDNYLNDINKIDEKSYTILSYVLKSYEKQKKQDSDPEKLKEFIDVINYLRVKGAKAEDKLSEVILKSIDQNTSVTNILLSDKKEKITDIDPTLPINYTWIGTPTEYNRFAISGHDVAGPIEMVKTIHKQARKNNIDLYNESKNYGKVNFYCIDEYADYYNELFKRHLDEFNNERYHAEINVFGVKNYLLNNNNNTYSNKIISHIEKLNEGETLCPASKLPSLGEVIKNNKKISSLPEYDEAIKDNIKKSRYFALVKDAFTLFLLWNSKGYILDTNVIPHRETPLQLANFSKPASMVVPNIYEFDRNGNFHIFNDYYCIFSPEQFNEEIGIWLDEKIKSLECSPDKLTLQTGFNVGYISGEEIGLCKINFSSHRSADYRRRLSSQNISIKSFYDLPEWVQEVYYPFINKEYEDEKNCYYKNIFRKQI